MHYFSKILILISFVALFACQNKDDSPTPPEKSEKTYIIISDIHLCDIRSLNDGYSWTTGMKDTLGAFLDYLAEDDNWDELIIAGDLIDEWIAPPSYPTFGDTKGNVISEKDFFENVIETNSDIFDKLYTLKNNGKTLVYIHGNHDMLVNEEDFDKLLPGLFEFGNIDQYVGSEDYSPESNISVEHGHRYDITNAPYSGKVGVDNIPEGSILPPGFFVARNNTGAKIAEAIKTKNIEIDTTGILDKNIYNLYWDVIGLLFGTPKVVTMADGMTKEYGFLQYAYNSSILFNNIDDYNEQNDGWNIRCEHNGAKLVPTVTESILSTFIYDLFDKIGIRILDQNPSGPRILVMGHTHAPKLIKTEDGTGIYLNTGCWVDANIAAGKENTSTFGKIKHDKSGYEISICRFDIDEYETPVVTTIAKEEL